MGRQFKLGTSASQSQWQRLGRQQTARASAKHEWKLEFPEVLGGGLGSSVIELRPWGLLWQWVRGCEEGVGPSGRLGNLRNSLTDSQREPRVLFILWPLTSTMVPRG